MGREAGPQNHRWQHSALQRCVGCARIDARAQGMQLCAANTPTQHLTLTASGLAVPTVFFFLFFFWRELRPWRTAACRAYRDRGFETAPKSEGRQLDEDEMEEL